MSSIIFTYYSENVSHSFLTNVESWLNHGEKYDSLVICSELELPKKIVTRLIDKIRVLRVLPCQVNKEVRKRSNRAAQWNINPSMLSAFNYSQADTITVIDPNVFIIRDIDFEKTDSTFFKSHTGFISPNIFKFKYSKSLEQIANQILSKMDFQLGSSDLIFSQFVTQCTAFGTKSFSTKSFIFSKPDKDHKFLDSKVFAIDFSNITDVLRFRELASIKDALLSSKKTSFLSRIRKTLHEFIDTVNLTPDPLLKQVPVLPSNYEKYKDTKIKNFPIVIIHTKQVANHAKRLEEILKSYGFTVSNRLLGPNSPIGKSSKDLHIVMCPNVFYDFPQNYIAYQFEQAHSKWFTQDYINKLNNSIEIWEYSEYNIQYFNGSFKKPHVYAPIGDLRVTDQDLSQNRDIDILFYGEFMNSPRRKQFLDEISKHKNIKIVDGFSNNNTFGNSITDLLKRTKVVLNHHFYENGQLEVVRLYEALSYGCKVVSEVSIDDSFHDLPILKYSNLDQALILLDQALTSDPPEKFIRDSSIHIKNGLSRLGFNFSSSTITVDNLRTVLTSPRQKGVAVYLHLYYTDLWNEIQPYLANIPEKFELYVNFVEDTYNQKIAYQIIDQYPSAKLFNSKNIGRDFGGFYTMLNYSTAGQSDVSFLIHSKKSKTSNVKNGDQWRKDLLDTILGSPEIAKHTISKIRSENVGVVSSKRWRMTNPSQIGSNADHLSRLSARLGYDYSKYPLDFTAGSIIAANTSLLEDIFKSLNYSDFIEGDYLDGTMAHALERFIPNYAIHKKYKLEYV